MVGMTDNIKRKKHTGQPGNPGEFGNHDRAEAAVNLGTDRSMEARAALAEWDNPTGAVIGADGFPIVGRVETAEWVISKLRHLVDEQAVPRPTRGGTPAFSASNVDVLDPEGSPDEMFEMLVWDGTPEDTDAAFVIAGTQAEVRSLIRELEESMDTWNSENGK